MAITTPVLGATTLPQVDADGYTETPELRGATTEMVSGALATDLVNASVKRRFELSWRTLTEAEVTSIVSAWSTMITSGSASFTSPNGGSYTVTHDDQLTLPVRWEKITATGLLGGLTLRLRQI